MSRFPDWMDFQPHKDDLGKVLGDLEADLMKTLWEIKSGDVKKIHKTLRDERKVAVTTVATVLDRLYSKGLVERELVKEGGIRYIYTPSMTRKQFESKVVRNVLKGLFESFGESAISYLIQSSEIENEEVSKELRKLFESLRDVT